MHYLITLLILLASNLAGAERIKDISSIKGVRINQLIGYGLVVGLDGTGDGTVYTSQSFKTLLSRLGIQLPPGINPESRNIAAVAVHAELPPFGKVGQLIDVTVSSIGNASSLRGGTLLLTPLKAANNKVYAVSQGNLVVGGLGAEGLDGSRVTINIKVVGRIPNGATIEVDSPSTFADGKDITLLLHRSDFTTARRMADAINQYIGFGTANPVDGSTVSVAAPTNVSDRVRFISALENLSLMPGDESAKIIVSSRTGTVVVGKHVMVGPAAISHGSLTVTVTENPEAIQPEAFSEGETVVVQNSGITVTQEDSRMFVLQRNVDLNSIVKAVNQVGAAPGDLMAILEGLDKAGALSAKLEII